MGLLVLLVSFVIATWQFAIGSFLGGIIFLIIALCAAVWELLAPSDSGDMPIIFPKG
jgi:hypothetical protein